jgi:hypothetical protein
MEVVAASALAQDKYTDPATGIEFQYVLDHSRDG